MKAVRILSFSIILLSTTQSGIKGQEAKPSAAPSPESRVVTKSPQARKTLHRKWRRAPVVIPAVTVLHNPEYLSGEVRIEVASNSNPLIRIGMAQNGVTLIEFPSADKFFAVHAGNSDLVTVEKSPSLKRDHHLVLRAGSGFLVTPLKSQLVVPATSIIAQMDSGIAITLMIYPVPLLKQQAHRLVINYDHDQVIIERRKAGLATNLVGPEPTAQSDNWLLSYPPVVVEPTPAIEDGINDTAKSPKTGKVEFKEPVEEALREALANPAAFKRWGAPRHGLSISTISPTDINDSTRLVVFAIRNMGVETLRLISGYPDLYVETVNDNRKPVETESRIDKLYLASNSTDRTIPSGAIRVFAVAYEAPILGVRQHLKIVAAHMNAADEPATANVTTTK